MVRGGVEHEAVPTMLEGTTSLIFMAAFMFLAVMWVLLVGIAKGK